MEIRLTRNQLKGSHLIHMWEEMEEIYVNNNDISLILISEIARHLNLIESNIKSKTRYRKYVRAREMYCGLIKAVSKKDYPLIALDIDRTHATVLHLIYNFRSFYINEKKYRHDVHSIAVNLPVKFQEKIYNYLKQIDNAKAK